MKYGKWAHGLVVAGLLVSGAAQATLIDRGGGLLYDTVLNVTWLQDANYAQTSGYDSDGRMNWSQANTWANNLSYYDSLRNQTLTGWRLTRVVDTGAPGCDDSTNGTDCGYNVSTIGNELAYMYYVNLGLHGYFDTSGAVDPTWGIYGNGTGYGFGGGQAQGNVGLINNLQSYDYWTGTAYALSSASDAWLFGPYDGAQGYNDQSTQLYAWAVRDGDVGASGVPEPASLGLALFGAGLVGLRRRRCFGTS